MKAMLLDRITDMSVDTEPLLEAEIPEPEPDEDQLLLRIRTCGVCHTELDEIEGRTPPPRLPVVPGHQVVGVVEDFGNETSGFKRGDRVGVAWIYSACGTCRYCKEGYENLCSRFRATGRDEYGGYAGFMTVPALFAHRIPEALGDEETAPLLCAGAIGYRSLALTGIKNGDRLGLTGFGASGHIVLSIARFLYPDSPVYVFARNMRSRALAREMGAIWAGDTYDTPPEKLHAIIDTTPVWKPVLEALKHLKAGGHLVINAIRKEDADQNSLLELSYENHLWMEKEIKSVANVTRKDVANILKLAARNPVKPEIEVFPLHEANRALMNVKSGVGSRAKVLKIG